MNYFNTTMSQMDRYDRSQLPYIFKSIKEGSAKVNERMESKIREVQKKKDYLVVQTPVQWA